MSKEVKDLVLEREYKNLTDAVGELSSEDWQVRLRAITNLVQLRKSDEFFRLAVPAIIKATKDNEPLVRQAAIPALGDIGAKVNPAVECLIEILSSSIEDEVKGAVYSLGKIGPEAISAVKKLLNLFSTVSEETHKAISWAISIIGPESIPDLKNNIDNPDIQIRKGVIVAIGNMGPVAISLLDDLIGCLENNNPVVRLEAARAVGNLRASNEVIKAISSLAKLLEDSDPDVRWSAAEALRKIGTDEAMKAWATYVPIANIEAIAQQLTNQDKAVRENAASSLYDVLEKGKDNKLDLLKPAFKDNHWKVLSSLCDSLCKIEEESMGLLGEICDILEHDNAVVRKSAVTLLGKMNNSAESVVDYIIKMLNDGDKEVRIASAVALELIGGKKAEKALKNFDWA